MSYFRRKEAPPIQSPQTDSKADHKPFFQGNGSEQNQQNHHPFFSKEGADPVMQKGRGQRHVTSKGNGVMQAKEIMPIQTVWESKEPVEGRQKKQIPDTSPMEMRAANEDTIAATMNHVSTVSQSGAVTGNNFGITRSTVSITNQSVTSSGTTHTLTADVIHTITWQVQATLGPGGQKDISSENDTDITAANYVAVADDLTPNASGRPPRSSYWAKDLTERHERYHAYTQRQNSFGPSMVTVIQNWLNTQTITGASDINATLLQSAQNQGVIDFNMKVALASTENDAYADGKSAYQARADAIRTKGDGGGY